MKRQQYILLIPVIIIIACIVLYFRIHESFQNHTHTESDQAKNLTNLIKLLKKYPDNKFIASIPIKKRKYSTLDENIKPYAENKPMVKKLIFNKKIKSMTQTEKDLFVNTLIENNFGKNTFKNIFGYDSLPYVYTKFKDYKSKENDNKTLRRFIAV